MENFQHILAFPVCLPGHLIPTLNLCSKFAVVGCKRITFLVNQDQLELMKDMVRQAEESGDMIKGIASCQALPVVFPPAFTGGDEQIKRMIRQSEETAGPARNAAIQVASASKSSIPISCVFADLINGWAQDIADELGVPRVVLSIQPLAEFAIVLHMPTLIAQGSFDPCREESWESSSLIHVPGLPPLCVSDIPQVSQYPRTNKFYWAYLLRVYSRLCEAQSILINTCYDLEKDAYEAVVKDHGLPVHLVGPLLSPPRPNSRYECLEWLDQKAPRSVLYISFGSFLQWTSSELEGILSGIQEGGYAFLLAFRKDVLVDDPSPALEEFLQQFSASDPKSSRKQQQGFIVAWTPQVDVLNHSSVGGFFTHYGWNSVSEGIAAGVPIMGKPVLGDQFVIRKLAIEKWKIAVEIEETNGSGRMAITKTSMKNAVTRLMQDEEIKANAARLKLCVQKAIDSSTDFLSKLHLA